MGPPLGSSLGVCIRTRSDRRLFLNPCFLVPSRNGSFHLGFSVFEFLHDGVTLFRVEHLYSYVLNRIEGTYCCWLLRPCLACRFAIWQLSVFFWPHLLLRYEFQFCWLLVLYLSALRLPAYGGGETLYCLIPPVCSGSAEFLWILYYYLAQNLHDGVTPLGFEAVSVLDRNEGLVWTLFHWLVRVFAMRSPFWVETVFVSFSIVTKTLLTFYLVGSGPSRWGHPFRVEFAVWAYALDRNEVLFLNHIPRSFRMRSPF